MTRQELDDLVDREPGGEHYVALVAGYVVGLTACQYSEELPLPLMWETS